MLRAGASKDMNSQGNSREASGQPNMQGFAGCLEEPQYHPELSVLEARIDEMNSM